MINKIYCVFKFYLILFIQVSFSEEYNLFGIPGQGYIVQASLGHPPQKLSLLVDTGSSDITVASRAHPDITKYFHAENSSSYRDYGNEVQAKFTTGDLRAHLGSDFIKFPSLNVSEVRCDVALITEVHDFYMRGAGWQGLLGLAYPAVSAAAGAGAGGAGGAAGAGLWLGAVEAAAAAGRSVRFSLELCGVRGPESATHYGSFRVLESSETINQNITFKTPILRKTWFEVGTLSVRVLPSRPQHGVTSTSMPLFVTDEGSGGNPAVDAEFSNDCRILNERISILDSGTTNIRLPEKIFTKVVEEIRRAVLAANNTFITLNDQFWYHGEAVCSPQPRHRHFEWSLPWLAVDLPSAGSERQYFTVELPPQNYMRLVSARGGGGGGGGGGGDGGDGGAPELCYKLGVERGSATVLGVAAIEGARVTFDREAGHIAFETSDCGPPLRLTGPHTALRPLPAPCRLPTTHNEIRPVAVAQWLVAGALAIAMTLVIYLLAPCVRARCEKGVRSAGQMSLSSAALVEESDSR